MLIGVLALQGAYEKHAEKIRMLGHESLCIKTPDQLAQCTHLILPGGESTTLLRLLERDLPLKRALVEFVFKKPVWGSCAGLILLARSVVSPSQVSFGAIDVSVERNGYGRQRDSFFTDQIEVVDEQLKQQIGGKASGYFIRAPRIVKIGKGVSVAMICRGDVVAAYQGNVCVSTFHPELTEDPYFHDWFIRAGVLSGKPCSAAALSLTAATSASARRDS